MALDPTALFTLSYGLYVLTARECSRDCGCIVNTVTQLTEDPTRIMAFCCSGVSLLFAFALISVHPLS